MPDQQRGLALKQQALTAATFVEMVDTLVDDFDVIDLLTILAARSVELLEVAAAGILLADNQGRLRVMAASSEQVQLLELFQLQNDEGPCLECFTTGTAVVEPDLANSPRWPLFTPECVEAGFLSVCAVPLRLRSVVLGCLNLFMSNPTLLPEPEIVLARALADVASIAIVQDQSTRLAAIREGQLQHALTSRIAIEQAKGMIAERFGLDMDAAFSRLRTYARNNNRGLTEVADSLVAGRDRLEQFANPPPPPATR